MAVLLLLIILLLKFFIDPFGYCLQQERAVIDYYDPQYIKHPQAFTFRKRRGEPYKSNLTVTTLHAWGNNVTFIVEYKQRLRGKDVIIKNKICVLLNTKWVRDFLLSYVEDLPKCPAPPGIYGIYNVELPPKNFPLPIPKGESTVVITYLLEDIKKILQFSVKVK